MSIHEASNRIGVPAELRDFGDRHVAGALKLSQEMGWPYRLEDWEVAARLGKGLVLERAGEVIGTALWWTYGQSFATAGMIIITGTEQGRGHGARLFNALLAATEGRNLLLNSTDEGYPLYARRGFTPWGRVLQHQGQFAADAELPARPHGIRSATPADLAAIQRIDEGASGMPRSEMVATLAGMGRVMVVERAGQIAGYSIARKFGRGHVVGPVAAQDAEDARQLILAQLAELRGEYVRIDVYAHDGLGDWLAGLGLVCTGQAAAMVKGQQPVTDGAIRIFALANQSFG